jgi:hypothetical protein
MTRVFIGSKRTMVREFPYFKKLKGAGLDLAYGIVSGTSRACTLMLDDYPIILFHVTELDAALILAHEENHRALLSVGEPDAARCLDHPRSRWLIEGLRADRGYVALYQTLETLRSARV